MTKEELQKVYLEKGYALVEGGGETNYVLIPVNNPQSLWTSFDSLESAEKALKKLNEPVPVKEPVVVPCSKKEMNFFSLKDEVEYCLKTNGIKAIVFSAKKGEHSVKVVSDTELHGRIFDSGSHKIHFGMCIDMFKNKFYYAGRMK